MQISFKKNSIHTSVKIIDDTLVNTFKNELLQVLITILTNAKDALQQKTENQRNINITVIKDQIIISDNAGGIDNSIIEKIFEPYFTTKQAKNGTGLGLYTAKTIMEKNIKGKISVKNIEDGVSFILKVNNGVSS